MMEFNPMIVQTNRKKHKGYLLHVPVYIHIISSPLQEQIDELMAQNARDEEEDQEEEEEEEESWIFIQNKNHLISKALFSSYPKFLCESPSIQSLTFGLETQCIL